jgi:hypothetical protein
VLAVIGFIILAAGAALYAGLRPTVAHGDVLAADLVKANPRVLSTMVCDPEVPIGLDGATFWCEAVFVHGPPRRLHFAIARTGAIKQIGTEHAAAAPGTQPEPKIDKADEVDDFK